MRRRLVALSGVASGAAAVLAYRRWLTGRRERLELYFDDGSFVALAEGSPDAERLLPLARRVLAAVRRPPSEWPAE